MVNKLLELMLEGETDTGILQDVLDKMQEQKKIALEEIGRRIQEGASDSVDFYLD